MSLSYTSFGQIQKDLTASKISCLELVQHYLTNIEKNKNLNAFLAVYEQEALLRAKEIDEKLKVDKAGRLAGMVIGLKDVFCYAEHGLQASSKILNGFESQFTATCVQRLLDEDAIIIGRQNCDEFAMGSSNETSAFGPVKNALGENLVPGGSSGGSAVAVQADMCLVALGSDTGGSVRQPAALCGIMGFKPTYSRISRHGLIAYASSFDTVGAFAKSSEDLALVLEIMAGADEFDSTVSQREVPNYQSFLAKKPEKLRIAYIDNTISHEGVNPEVRKATQDTIAWLKSEGHTLEAVDFSLLEYALPVYYILTTAEASTNLARFDGVRYGYRSPNVTDIESLYKKSRSEGFGREVKRRIMLGTFVLSASYYDAYFTKAQKVRRLIREQTLDFFQKFDFLICPTTPTTAFKIGELSEKTVEMYLSDLFTVQASVAGVPAISVPNGQDSNNLPIGLQIMASAFEEGPLLSFANYLIKRTS
ncbi:MAG: Asp-tRNA(Asn)/Glu-tRNA(Gln) amidotransferase subunit GatA [Cytophagales bacterium]|nr:MAG: Asp-tRNA(Asn)/Glu-tRNA(Gln) amidotransferase subunit GatA [Cytophagales bacterium]TAF60957.1 MAG: Asp-tRNA(Asn)/Glu-tRNA(Gln) amidotransferase subunit GatA [Cytophagales bacterium]